MATSSTTGSSDHSFIIMPVDLEQSIPICCGLAALGGILEVRTVLLCVVLVCVQIHLTFVKGLCYGRLGVSRISERRRL